MSSEAGRHFLQIPGPTNVPDRVLRAMAQPTIDHRGPQFASLTKALMSDLGAVFGTEQPVLIFPASGTGAWEAALVNTLSPGDRVLMYETGHFATLWRDLAKRLGVEVRWLEADWRGGVDPRRIEQALAADRGQSIKAVAVVHNETSTGVTSAVPAIRAAIDAASHSALLLVDTISSLASIDYRHDEWGVDATVAGSQKGLMLPPGLGFNAISEKALAASTSARLPRSYWDWQGMLGPNASGFFPYTPPTNLLLGLRESLCMLLEEGLSRVFVRHARHAQATRRAVRAWNLELQCQNPAEHSNSLTAVRMPAGETADGLRRIILERFDMSLGSGLGRLADRVFRIGHLGSFNDLMLAGTLCGVEMGLELSGIDGVSGGVSAALDHLRAAEPPPTMRAATAVGTA